MTTEEADRIPIAEFYRGVGVHDSQPRRRIDLVVKPAIDKVHEMNDVEALFAYAGDILNPPEARLLAAAKAEASWQIAADERRVRPDINLDKLHARVAGLNSRRWRNPWAYCSLLDVSPVRPGGPEAVKREERLPKDRPGTVD